MITHTPIKERGDLDIFYKFNDHNKPIMHCSNIAVSSGSSVVASALAGKGGLSYLYLAYVNGDSDISYLPIVKTTTIAAFTGLAAPYGCIKVPVYLLGDVAPDMFTVQGITTNSAPLSAAMSDFTVGSKVFSVGLVGVVNSSDTLFAVANIKDTDNNNSYISKIANAQVGINWTVSLGIGD